MFQHALEIHTFGGVEIYRDGRLVGNLGSRKGEALLVYLAFIGRPVSRESLATLLWGDSPQTNALASLSVALNQLRKQLAPFIIAGRHTVAFNQEEDAWLDAAILETKLSEWEVKSKEETAADSKAIELLEESVALYRGDFLAGFSVRDSLEFEEWASLERERLRLLVIDGLDDLIDHCIDHSRYQVGITHARRLLTLDPLREETHRQLMLLLARDGQWSGALSQYKRCCEILSTELETEPMPETTDLYERIRLAMQRPRHNMPAQATSFIGREDELNQVRDYLADPSSRLVTFVGPGGIGKTRLAQETGLNQQDHYMNGVWFVELAPLSEPMQVIRKIASVLEIDEGGTDSSISLTGKVVDILKRQELLLILDNCEHLLDICAEICHKILVNCPDVTLLATSRQRLDVIGEIIWDAPTLKLPSIPGEEIDLAMEYDAIRLFVDRARMGVKEFNLNEVTIPWVTKICTQLEGIPLAIEFAAARLRYFSLAEIFTGLEDRFQFLEGGRLAGPAHQRTLRATVDWSYDLLTEAEKLLFDRLSVFRGGFHLDAAREVCQGGGIVSSHIPNHLVSLVDKSLVMVKMLDDGSKRYDILETLREYGREKLSESKDKEAIHRRHAEYFLALAEQADPELYGPQQVLWGERLEVEHDNFRVVMNWTLDSNEIETASRLGVALWHGFWLKRGYYQEGRQFLEKVTAANKGDSSSLLGNTIFGLGALTMTESNYEQAGNYFKNSLEIGYTANDDFLVAWSIHYHGEICWHRGQFNQSEAFHNQSLNYFRKLDDQRGIAWQLYHLALIARGKGDIEQAVKLLDESHALHQEMSNSWALAWVLGLKGTIALNLGEYYKARQIFQEVLSINQELKSKRGQIYAYFCLGDLNMNENELDEAEVYFQKAYDMAKQVGDGPWRIQSLFLLARVTRIRGDHLLAKSLLDRSFVEAMTHDLRFIIVRGLVEYAYFAKEKNNLSRAAVLFGASKRLQQKMSSTKLTTYDEVLTSLREVMGEEAFEEAWATGNQMNLETAVSFARGESKKTAAS